MTQIFITEENKHLLNNLPSDLVELYIFCKVDVLPELPPTLKRLACSHNCLISLPELPSTLKELDCQRNKLITLPELPITLEELYCDNNQLTTLPDLPSILRILHCSGNQLTTLPDLPQTLKYLSCDRNIYEYYGRITNNDVTDLIKKVNQKNADKSQQDYIMK
jgi:E3 ubiquitin-protein ligase SspH2